MKRAFFLCGVLIAVVLSSTCTVPPGGVPSPGGDGTGGVTPAAGVSLSGLAYDSLTGSPLSGVRLDFASTSVTTASDGLFSLDIATSELAVEGILSVTRPDYRFVVAGPISLPVGSRLSFPVPLIRTDYTKYSSLTSISGNIYSSSDVEIPSESSLSVSLFGGNGTYDSHEGLVYDHGYSLSTPLVADDCLIIVEVRPPEGTWFAVARRGVSLAGSGSRALDFIADNSQWVAVSLNAGAVGNSACGAFMSDGYGQIPMLLRDPSRAQSLTKEMTLDEAPKSAEVFNPFAWSTVAWMQKENDTAFAVAHAGHEKTYCAVSSEKVLAAEVDLPAIDSTLGPDEPASRETLTYTSPMLSQDPVTGAKLYLYSVRAERPDGDELGTIWASEPELILPAGAHEAIDSFASIHVSFRVADMGVSLPMLMSVVPQRAEPSTSFAYVNGVAAGTFYESLLDAGTGTAEVNIQ